MSKTDAIEGPSGPSGAGEGLDVHPAVRNAVRLCLSAREYRLLHDLAIQRAPDLKNKLPSSLRDDIPSHSRNRHNMAALRASLRIFVGSSIALSLGEKLLNRIQGNASKKKARTPLSRNPVFRLSVSMSLLLLLHRLLYRFLIRLRQNLRTDDAKPFRERNPRISRALTSRLAPAIGASLAGFTLAICPDQLRLTAAIYWSTRSLEFLFNVMDFKGWLEQRPWWFGSWLLMPVSCAQLFHAFVFNREATPRWFGSVILKLSPSYIASRPESLPSGITWPEKEQIVDSLASISSLRWPAFVSPILHPNDPNTLPASVKSISPITGPAHPSIASLSCALLHPSLPNCSTAFLHHILLSVPPLARFLTTVTLALSIPKFKSILAQPLTSVNTLSKRVIKMTAVLSAVIGSTWGSVCLLNSTLPRSTLPTQRFFLSGALGGLPFVFLGSSRSVFMYFFRAAIDSAWKTGRKRGLWKGGRGGEVWLFVLSWAVIGSILEANPTAVQGLGIRKYLSWLRGDGWTDSASETEKRKARKAKKENP